MITASEALARLALGNRRFVSGASELSLSGGQERLNGLASGQAPFAIILGCSDSRVPVEIVFDQGLGDLFVVRVAGNIIAPSQVASVEFAAARFGTRLAVVLGHSMCGAVHATLQELGQPQANRSLNLRAIVNRIRPALESLHEANPGAGVEALLPRAVRANIRASVNQLNHGSDLLESLIQAGELLVVGAEYSVETGRVDFFEGQPSGAGGQKT